MKNSICNLHTKRTPKLKSEYQIEWVKYEDEFLNECNITLRNDFIKPRYFTSYIYAKSNQNPICLQINHKIFDTTNGEIKDIKFNKKKNQIIFESNNTIIHQFMPKEHWYTDVYKGFITVQLNQKGWKKLLRYIKNLLIYDFKN
jgi:hypothetical protein